MPVSDVKSVVDGAASTLQRAGGCVGPALACGARGGGVRQLVVVS